MKGSVYKLTRFELGVAVVKEVFFGHQKEDPKGRKAKRKMRRREVASQLIKDAQIQHLEQQLGYRVIPGSNGEAVFVPLKEDLLIPAMVIGEHHGIPRLSEILDSKASHWRVMSRATRMDNTLMQNALLAAKGLRHWQPEYVKMLDLMDAIYAQQSVIRRHMVITGPAYRYPPNVSVGAENSLAGAKALGFGEVGTTLWNAVSRSNVSRTSLDENPLWYAIPGVEFWRQHAQIGADSSYQLSLWEMVVDAAGIEKLMSLDVDVIVDVENDRWLRVLVYTGGSEQDLDAIGSSLRAIGKAVRLRGYHANEERDMAHVLMSSLPGSPLIPNSMHVGVDEDQIQKFLNAFEKAQSGESQNRFSEGTIPVGRTLFTNETIALNPLDYAKLAVIGPLHTGKTDMSWKIASSRGPNTVMLVLSDTDQETVKQAALSFGGSTPPVTLPAVKTLEQYDQMTAAVDRLVQQTIFRQKSDWETHGFCPDLPMILSPGEGDHLAYIYYAYRYLDGVRNLIRAFNSGKNPQPFTICISDMTGLTNLVGLVPTELEKKAEDLQRKFYDLLENIGNTARKLGIVLIIDAHSASEIRNIGKTFFSSLPLLIRLRTGTGFQIAELWYPPDIPEGDFSVDIDALMEYLRQGMGVDQIRQLPEKDQTGKTKPIIPNGFIGPFNYWLPPNLLALLEGRA